MSNRGVESGRAGRGTGVMAPVVAALSRVRSAARRQLVTQRSLWMLAAILLGGLALGFIDYLLRLPMPIRLLHLAAGLVALVIWFRRSVVPAITFRPSLTDVALRLEKSSPGKNAGLPGLLASGLELADTGGAAPLSDELGDTVAARAAERYAAFARSASIFDRRLLGRSALAALAAAVPIAALVLLAPTYARIGAVRTLAPWAAVSWPKRTGIVDAGAPMAHAAGAALPLRALLVKTDRAEGKTDVTLSYRLIVGGEAQEERRVLMTPQNKRAAVTQADVEVSGELYERLLDADAITAAGAGDAGTKVLVEYWFRTSDDETTPAQVLIVQPPAIVAAMAKVTPPAYAAGVIEAPAGTDKAKTGGAEQWLAGERDVGPGSPARGVVGPILAGSRVEFALRFNKPLPALLAGPGEMPPAEWAAQFFPGAELLADVSVGALADGTFVLGFNADRPLRLPVAITDEHGIASGEDYAFRLEVLDDRAPTVAIVDPSQDEAVLPTAVIAVAGEGRDDVAMRSVAVRRQTAKPAAGSVGAAPDPVGEPEQMSVVTAAADGGSAPLTLRTESILDLGPLALAPGDEVWLTAAAADIFEVAGAPRAEMVSAKRRLRIIAEAELIEQVQAELSALREAAKRAEQDQSRLSEKATEARDSEQAALDQAPRQEAVTQRLRPMQDAVDRLQKRIERNQLGDKALEGVLQDAGELVQSAQKESGKASDALDRLGQRKNDRANDPTVKKAAEELGKAQEQAAEDLSQLANMLDRGQDDWAVRRAIEKALTEQKQLRAQTSAAGKANQGKESQQLTENERQELNRLAKQQAELAQRAQAMVDSVRQRSEQMQEADPAQAQAMQNAAQKAQKQELAKKQREASEQINQNKTGEAEQTQQQAENTLEEMLEELDKSQQNRDEALRRVLADVMQSIAKLIQQQEAELARLADADAGKVAAEGLDASMITLQRNTLGVAGTVKSQMRGAEVLAGLISAAAEAQSAAVVSLRGVPPDHPEADANERVSLKRLRDALEEARRLDGDAEEREEDRKRAELKKAYKELLELQVSVTADIAPIVGKELDRRQRSFARGVGTRQEELRARMAEVREKTSEFAEVQLFDYAHTRYENVSDRAAKALLEGSAPASVGRDQSTAVRILQGLVQALDDGQKQKDEFKEDEPQGGEGGGSGPSGPPPLIPPFAELKLLRAMQAEAMDRTREVGDGGEKIDAAELSAIGKLQKDLADHATALLEKLTREQEQGQPGMERN